MVDSDDQSKFRTNPLTNQLSLTISNFLLMLGNESEVAQSPPMEASVHRRKKTQRRRIKDDEEEDGEQFTNQPLAEESPNLDNNKDLDDDAFKNKSTD